MHLRPFVPSDYTLTFDPPARRRHRHHRHHKEHPMPDSTTPTFDKSTLDTLVANLEDAEATLARANDVNTTAEASAATARTNLANAQAANKAAVQAIKDYVASLDADGNRTVTVTPPAPTGGDGTTPPTDTGTPAPTPAA